MSLGNNSHDLGDGGSWGESQRETVSMRRYYLQLHNVLHRWSRSEESQMWTERLLTAGLLEGLTPAEATASPRAAWNCSGRRGLTVKSHKFLAHLLRQLC